MWLAFEAPDVWFFRDGRPFDAGDAHTARSRFPPPPDTVLGIARAVLLQERFAASGLPGATLPAYQAWLSPGNGTNRVAADLHNLFAAAKRDLGSGAGAGDLRLRGPFVALPEGSAGTESAEPGSRLLLPIPRDLRALPNHDQPKAPHRLVRLEPLPDGALTQVPDLAWSDATGNGARLSPQPLVVATKIEESIEDLEPETWLSGEQMRRYLTEPVTDGFLAVRSRPSRTETRTGVALDLARRTREGHLYRADFIRPSPADRAATPVRPDPQHVTQLLARLEPDPPGAGPWWLNFGGEGRLAMITRLPDNDGLVTQLDKLLDPAGATAQTAIDQIGRTGWLRLVLLQPAIFSAGWWPDAVDTDGRLRGANNAPHPFALRAAAVAKPEPISGWDLSTGGPKPLRRAVPAGSVYHFEYVGPKTASERAAAARAVVATFHGAELPGAAPTRAGYGLAVVGACQPQQPAKEQRS